jgi:hypothetical protein
MRRIKLVEDDPRPVLKYIEHGKFIRDREGQVQVRPTISVAERK